ncbi:MAG: TIGR03943 family protein [Actinomycetota bacterium]|nr:TIGR03943 family protein [Actinomycetota bacterium]
MRGIGGPRTVVLALWSAFFVWLLLSGKVNVYIGPRTYWVIVFGAVCLVAATAGSLVLSRPEQEASTAGSTRGYLVMLAPILLVLAVPEPSLGALAASRKTAGAGSLAALQPRASDGEMSFQEISYALTSEEYATSLGLVEGYEIDVTGFVAEPSAEAPGALVLGRFSIFCCAADAVPYTIPVQVSDASAWEPDTWLRVRGSLAREGDGLVVVAEHVEKVDVPDDPYI